MSMLQIISTALNMICVVITTALAWVMLNKTNKTEVTFTGVPVDKKDFERHQRDNKEEHDRIFAKFDAMQGRINPIENQLYALAKASEAHTARLVLMDAKIDRLIERTK